MLWPSGCSKERQAEGETDTRQKQSREITVTSVGPEASNHPWKSLAVKQSSELQVAVQITELDPCVIPESFLFHSRSMTRRTLNDPQRQRAHCHLEQPFGLQAAFLPRQVCLSGMVFTRPTGMSKNPVCKKSKAQQFPFSIFIFPVLLRHN